MSVPINTKIPSEIRRLLARSFFYKAVGVLLRRPEPDAKDLFLGEEEVSWEETIETIALPDKERLKEAFEFLKKELRAMTRRGWIRQYEDSFGHTAHGPVPIYELEYGEEHSHRQPQQLGDIAAFYRAFGLKPNERVHERVDHIVVECEFMHFLLFKQAYALKHGWEEKAEICREASLRFLSEHLGRWGPAFTLKLAKHAGGELLKRIAQFAFTFIVQECRQLGISPGPNDLPIRAAIEKEESGCMTCSLNPEAQG